MDNWCIIITFIVIELRRGFYEQHPLSVTLSLALFCFMTFYRILKIST